MSLITTIGELLTAHGLKISGMSPDCRIVETVEVPENDFFVGVQFHPEFKSRPNKGASAFSGFCEGGAERPVEIIDRRNNLCVESWVMPARGRLPK